MKRVAVHFTTFGLECKQPDHAADGAQVLGLYVHSADGQLQWRCDNPVVSPPTRVTHRAVFAWCRWLVTHLPMSGWLQPAAAWLKQLVNVVTHSSDIVMEDDFLCKQMECVATQLVKEDPLVCARPPGNCVDGWHHSSWRDCCFAAAR